MTTQTSPRNHRSTSIASTSIEPTTDQTPGTAVAGVPDPDFPFYAGNPTMISGRRWLVVMAACAAAFASLVALPLPGSEHVQDWTHALLFMALPLIALAWAAPRGWTAIFRKVGPRQVLQMFGFAALNIAVTTGIAMPLASLIGAQGNPLGATLAHESLGDKLTHFGTMVPQLVGEELITILPFLALMFLLVTKMHMSRRTAMIISWVATAVMFGLLHLPTYGWNVLQCLLIIGVARLVLTFAFLRTKNLAVSAGAHILNDWTLFALPLLVGGAAALIA